MRRCLTNDLLGDTSAREIDGVAAIGAAARTALLSKVSWAGVALAVSVSLSWGTATPLLLIPAPFLGRFLISLATVGLDFSRGGTFPERPIELPEPELFSDVEVQAAARRLIGTRQMLIGAIRESPRGPAFDLSPMLKYAPGFEKRIVVLLARAEYLGSFLQSASPQGVTAAFDNLRNREKASRTTGLQAAYRRSITQHEGNRETIRSIETDRIGVLAAVEYILSVLESLPARITRLQYLRLACSDAAAADESMSAAAELSDTLSAFETAHELEVDATRVEHGEETGAAQSLRGMPGGASTGTAESRS